MSFGKLAAPKGRMIVQIIEPKEKQVGGLILPNKDQERYVEAIIVDYNLYTDIGYTSKIIIDRYSGHHVLFDNEKYVILKSDEILALVEEEDSSDDL